MTTSAPPNRPEFIYTTQAVECRRSFLIPTQAGNSRIISAERPIPPSTYTLDIIEFAPRIITITVPHNTITRPEARSIILGYNIGIMLMDHQGVNVPLGAIHTGALLGMLSYAAGVIGIQNGNLEKAAKEAEITYRIRVIPNVEEEIRAIAHSPEYLKFADTMGEDLLKFHRSFENQLLPIALLSLLIGKRVAPESYDIWTERRIRAFEGTLGLTPDDNVWSVSKFPDQPIMDQLYRFISSKYLLRKHVFFILVALAHHKTCEGIFRDVLNFISGAELTPFLLVDYYIFSKYREILNFRGLRSNLNEYQRALNKFLSWPKEERLFTKILHSKEETYIFSRSNFPKLADVAMVIARHENPSMRNYNPKDMELASVVCELVQNYLSNRDAVGLDEVILFQNSDMPAPVTRKLLRLVNEDSKGKKSAGLEQITIDRDADQIIPANSQFPSIEDD